MSAAVTIPSMENVPDLPPVLLGSLTPEIKERVESFYFSVAAIFDAWVGRRKSNHNPAGLSRRCDVLRGIPKVDLAT